MWHFWSSLKGPNPLTTGDGFKNLGTGFFTHHNHAFSVSVIYMGEEKKYFLSFNTLRPRA